MNFNGGSSSSGIEGGGTISGNLEIDSDLKVDGNATFNTFTAQNGTVIDTLEVGVLVSDIKVEDPIIQLGVDNPSDNLNLGLVVEYVEGVPKYGGLLRSKDDKKFHLLTGLTTLPNGATDITQEQSGDLTVNAFLANTTITVENDFGFGRMSSTGFNTQIRSQNAVGGVGDVNRKSRGSRATPTAIIDNDGIFEEYNSGHDGVNYYDCVRTLTKADGDWTPTNHGATFVIETVDKDTTNITEKIKIDGAGTVLSGNILINNNLNFDNGLIVSSLGTTVMTMI